LKNLVSLLNDEKNIDQFIAEINNLNKNEIGKIVTMGNKNTWKNTIKAFEILGFDTWKYAIPEMLGLLQDINWPGSVEARDLLASVDVAEYRNEINSAISEAVDNNDYEWIDCLVWFVIDNFVFTLLSEDIKEKCKELFLVQAKF
jgi:hypothetical protein